MAKPVILVVDDDQVVLGAVARDLRRRYGKEFRILRADSGQTGLDTLQQLHERREPVAFLLSDQRMPQMSGVAFLQQAMEWFPDSKRALLTAYADTEAAIASINTSKIDYYLLKPWDPPEEKLYPAIDDLLEDWRAGYRPGYGGIRIIDSRWSPQAHQIKDFLARNHIPYQFLDIEESEEARDLSASFAESDTAHLPLVYCQDGTILTAPPLAEVADHIGLKTHAEAPFYDLAIVGAGPAGLAAAVYGASEGLHTVLIEREAPGGQAGTSSRIENYLGFPSGLSGADLARRASAQAKRFGVEILTPQEVTGLRLEGPYKYLTLSDGSNLSSHALMISTGISWQKLAAPGMEEFAGRGIYYGAAITEALHCKNLEVYVIGAGNSAGQAAIYLTEHAYRVIMLVRGNSLGAKMSHYLVERIQRSEKIEVKLHTTVEACHGSKQLEGLTLANTQTGATEQVETNYLFVFIGAAPRTDWLADIVVRDERGFILTGPDLDPQQHLNHWPLERNPFLLEASVPGVFAAGDVRHGSVKRVASAVGEGSVSVHFMHRHLASL